MRGMDKQTPVLRLPQDSQDEPIEKYEVERAFRQQGKSEKIDGGIQMSHGDFFWLQKLNQKMIARPESET
jgi:hypothetical protein